MAKESVSDFPDGHAHGLHVGQKALRLAEVGLEPEAGPADAAVEVLEQAGDYGDGGEEGAVLVGDAETQAGGPAGPWSRKRAMKQAVLS